MYPQVSQDWGSDKHPATKKNKKQKKKKKYIYIYTHIYIYIHAYMHTYIRTYILQKKRRVALQVLVFLWRPLQPWPVYVQFWGVSALCCTFLGLLLPFFWIFRCLNSQTGLERALGLQNREHKRPQCSFLGFCVPQTTKIGVSEQTQKWAREKKI